MNWLFETRITFNNEFVSLGKECLGPQPLNGGSAAQSTTFHVIDGFLGIKHAHDVEAFLAHHREYMPPKHREFIAWVRENVAKIPNLRNAPGYHEAILAVKKFREVHINVVRSYAVTYIEVSL